MGKKDYMIRWKIPKKSTEIKIENQMDVLLTIKTIQRDGWYYWVPGIIIQNKDIFLLFLESKE